MAHSSIRPPLAIRCCFLDFPSDETYCDVVIHVGDKTFLGHSQILTESSGYFRSELGVSNTPIKDKVVLTDVNAFAFGEIVHFIYTGSLRTLEIEDFYDLLRTYDVLEIRFPIEDQLMAGVGAIDKENKPIRKAFSLLHLAEDTGRPLLAGFMKQHILKHVEHFFRKDDDDFLKISHAHLKEIVERRYLPHHKLDLLANAILRWINHSYEERKEYFVPLLTEVDGDLARQFLKCKVAPIPSWKPR